MPPSTIGRFGKLPTTFCDFCCQAVVNTGRGGINDPSSTSFVLGPFSAGTFAGVVTLAEAAGYTVETRTMLTDDGLIIQDAGLLVVCGPEPIASFGWDQRGTAVAVQLECQSRDAILLFDKSPGPDEIPGPPGPVGPAGPAGANGQDGADGQDGLAAPLSSAIPIPDNEADAAIRTGSAGTSGNVSRADHNHPIRRQSNPGDPVITIAGTGAVGQLAQSIITDRWSTEETYGYHFRTLVRQTAGNNWDWLNVPAKAGFQQPDIYAIGTYRNQSISPQGDDNTGTGGNGAAPRGPFMGKEAHHWSSTNRIYLGYFRRDVDFQTYLEFSVEYKRA